MLMKLKVQKNFSNFLCKSEETIETEEGDGPEWRKPSENKRDV